MSEQSAGACSHDWQSYWDGSLGYSATDRCTMCGDYRPTPEPTEADSARAQATFEKYVEKAAEAIDPAAFDQSDPIHAGRQRRRDAARSNARVALAAVGPLIQEDMRTRILKRGAA